MTRDILVSVANELNAQSGVVAAKARRNAALFERDPAQSATGAALLRGDAMFWLCLKQFADAVRASPVAQAVVSRPSSAGRHPQPPFNSGVARQLDLVAVMERVAVPPRNSVTTWPGVIVNGWTQLFDASAFVTTVLRNLYKMCGESTIEVGALKALLAVNRLAALALSTEPIYESEALYVTADRVHPHHMLMQKDFELVLCVVGAHF